MRPLPDLTVGDAAPAREVGPLTRVDIARFAGAGGDFNPLHLDDEVARAAGFPAVIAMGQLPAGLLAGLLSDWVGVEHVRSYSVRFQSPVGLGDTIELSARVESIDTGTARLELLARVGDRPVVSGSAIVARA